MPRSTELTTKQAAILEFIREYRSRGEAPSYREIMRRFGINSPNGVKCHLDALAKKGYITFNPKMPRALRLVGECLPAWHTRPNVAGWWVVSSPDGWQVCYVAARLVPQMQTQRWYGPIPEPPTEPAGETNDR